MKQILLLAAVVLVAGCTSTRQNVGEIQRDYDQEGRLIKETEITTDTKVAAKLQSVQKAKSISSENTPEGQRIEIGDLDQQNDAATFTDALSKLFESALEKAFELGKAAAGSP